MSRARVREYGILGSERTTGNDVSRRSSGSGSAVRGMPTLWSLSAPREALHFEPCMVANRGTPGEEPHYATTIGT